MAHFSSSLSFYCFPFVSLHKPLVLDVLPVDLLDKMHGSTSYREERQREALAFSNLKTVVAQDINFRFIMQIRFKQ